MGQRFYGIREVCGIFFLVFEDIICTMICRKSIFLPRRKIRPEHGLNYVSGPAMLSTFRPKTITTRQEQRSPISNQFHLLTQEAVHATSHTTTTTTFFYWKRGAELLYVTNNNRRKIRRFFLLINKEKSDSF